jgi:hypothetical protein
MNDDTTRDEDDAKDEDGAPDVVFEVHNHPDWSDSDNRQLISFYENGDERTRGTINRVLIAVCGWSLPTLLKLATDPDFYKTANDRAIAPYWWDEGELPEKKP